MGGGIVNDLLSTNGDRATPSGGHQEIRAVWVEIWMKVCDGFMCRLMSNDHDCKKLEKSDVHVTPSSIREGVFLFPKTWVGLLAQQALMPNVKLEEAVE